MKTIFVFLLSVCLSGAVFGQLRFTVDAIPVEEVPEAVQTAQADYFPDHSVYLWEKQTATGPQQNAVVRIVASFKGQNNQVIRARYLTDGSGLSASTVYLSAAQYPTAIQDAVKQNYPDYTLMTGQKVEVLSTGNTLFRVRLRKSLTNKIVVYYDKNGEEISRNDIPIEVREEEDLQ